jgi:hypothetical protein
MVDIVIDGKKIKFQKYEEAPKETARKVKELKNCDLDGKELTWLAGNGGHFQYVDGTTFTGKRTEVYKMDDTGKVLAKNKRTDVVNTEECRRVDKRVVDDLNSTGEFFAVEDEGILTDLNEEALLVPIQLTEGYDHTTKVGLIYRDMDGILTLKTGCSLKSKQKEQAMRTTRLKQAAGLTSKRLVKEAKIGIEI